MHISDKMGHQLGGTVQTSYRSVCFHISKLEGESGVTVQIQQPPLCLRKKKYTVDRTI